MTVGLPLSMRTALSSKRSVKALYSRPRSRSNATLNSALDAALAIRNPPPPPEPTIVFVQEDDGSGDLGSRNFDVAKWAKKPRSWWR
jgi:hypothetical protein